MGKKLGERLQSPEFYQNLVSQKGAPIHLKIWACNRAFTIFAGPENATLINNRLKIKTLLDYLNKDPSDVSDPDEDQVNEQHQLVGFLNALRIFRIVDHDDISRTLESIGGGEAESPTPEDSAVALGGGRSRESRGSRGKRLSFQGDYRQQGVLGETNV